MLNSSTSLSIFWLVILLLLIEICYSVIYLCEFLSPLRCLWHLPSQTMMFTLGTARSFDSPNFLSYFVEPFCLSSVFTLKHILSFMNIVFLLFLVMGCLISFYFQQFCVAVSKGVSHRHSSTVFSILYTFWSFFFS